jgi:SOS-response transcriptional repressor LexA
MAAQESDKYTSPDLSSEFYDIPLLGEVRLVFSDSSRKPMSIGERAGLETCLINNFRQTNSRTITMRAMDNGLAGAGILEGDYLTTDLHTTARDGDIVAVKIGYHIYIRKIFHERNLIRLETSTVTPSPLIVDPKIPGFEIIGKIIAIIREL